jgi:hypothetical protein
MSVNLRTTVIMVISSDPSSSSLTNEEADEQPPQSVGSFIIHSMSVALFTSQLLSQIKSGTLVLLVYDRETVLQVVHNRGHGFSKRFTLQGCTNRNTRTLNLGRSEQMKTTRHHDKTIPRKPENVLEAAQKSYPYEV